MMFAATALALAIVTQDQVALRAAPRDSAQQQAQLWQGDSLEVRGEKGDFLQVWDHRRERGGYIRVNQARQMELTPAAAPQMLAVMNFVRDTPGQEALGIGYAAAFLKAAEPAQIGPEAFDALGTMADRLARRASSSRGDKASDARTAAQLEVAAAYGVGMTSFEREGRVQICYDGEAFRRVLAQPQSAPLLKARAALALTRHECVSPDLTPSQRATLDAWRIEVLGRVETAKLPEHVKNRIFMRRAGVLSAIAYQQQRRGEAPQETANRAIESLAAINKSELTEDDANSYSDAATRAGVVRWAASDAARAVSTLSVTTRPGQPGETCVQLVEAKQKAALFERCTYGFVYPASAAPNPQHTMLALAVQTLDTWRELWLFRKGADGWFVEVIPPSANGPDIGYIDFAGWVPGGKQMLTAREVRVEGRYKKSFELMSLDSLQVERWADKPESLTPFYRWQDPSWKRMTLSLR
ncbi:SH3 domain-containing protein [Uliginosibacterium flavum]